MNIYFDNIAFSIQKAGGVTAVWSELLKRVPVEYVKAYLEYPNNNIFRKELRLPQSKIIFKQSPCVKIEKLFDVSIRDNEKFIFHSSSYRICKSQNAINVITVHDFIDEYYNNNALRRKLKTSRMKHCIAKSDALICVSENTRKDLLHFYPKTDPSKIFVVHNGKSEVFKINESDVNIQFPNLHSQEYVLFVGNRKGYKNFKTLVEAMSLYRKKKLVIVGGGNLDNDELTNLNEMILSDNYVHYQGISNESLNLLYNNAYCLVYPSAYEGFGIPVIEAQSAGCPVIAANTSSLPEILHDSAVLLKQLNFHSIVKALLILEDTETRNLYISKGLDNALNYSWDTMAKQYLKIYNKFKNKLV
jgi:mannosyltransferase